MFKIRQAAEAIITLQVITNREQIHGQPIIRTERAKHRVTQLLRRTKIQLQGHVQLKVAQNRAIRYLQQVLVQKVRVVVTVQVHQVVQPPQKVILREALRLREATIRVVLPLLQEIIPQAVHRHREAVLQEVLR